MRAWLCAEAQQQAIGWSAANNARYCNPAYEDLYEKAQAEFDPDQRRALFIAMNDLLIDDVALIPLVQRPTPIGLSNDIELDRPLTNWDVDVWDIANWHRSN